MEFYEVWTEPGQFEFKEYEEVTKDSPFIGELHGEFFFPDKKSKNGRFYSSELWEKVLSSERTKDMLERRVLGGTIGHVDKDTDTLLREGEFAYIISSLAKKDGRGWGTALVLNNEVGRRLKLYLKAGMKLGTSTIGGGEVLEKKDDGTEVVDPDSYKLERIDLVVLPAFTPQEWAELRESLDKELNVDSDDIVIVSDDKEEEMDLQKMIEEISNEKRSLEKELVDAHKKIVTLESENENLKKELDEIKTKYESLKKYEGAEIDLEEVENQRSLIEAYRELGTPDEIREALEKSEEMLEKLNELGTIDEIEEALQKAKDFISKVEELGTLPEIEMALRQSEEFIQNALDEKNRVTAESLSAKYGVSVAHVMKLIESVGDVEEIEEMLSEIVPSDDRFSDEGDSDRKVESRANRIVKAIIG